MRERTCSLLISGALAVALFGVLPAHAQEDEAQRLQAAYDTARVTLAETQARAITSCAAVEAARAEQERAEQDRVCVTTLRPELQAMQAAGVSRADQRRQMISRLAECQGDLMEPVLVAQRACLADLEATDAAMDLVEATQQAIIDHNTEVTEFVRAVAGQHEEQARLEAEIAQSQAEIEASRARQQAMLAEAERILQSLARQ